MQINSQSGQQLLTSLSKRQAWQRLISVFLFALQRLSFGLLVLLSIIYLSFLGLDMAQGSTFWPAAQRAGIDTADYLLRLVQGDLGQTSAGSDSLLPRPVAEVLVERLPRSLALLGLALGLAALLGVLLGLFAAYSRTRSPLIVLGTTLIGISVPSFFAAFILQWLVIQLTRATGRAWLPVGGFGWDKHLILPVLVLAARPVAQITRVTFVSVRDIISQDYIRTAHSKGLRESSILTIHVLRNAAVPILTTVGVSLRFALSSLPVVEFFFGWLGAGFLLLKAISYHDTNLTIGLVLSLGVLFILTNLLLDGLYRLIDPRLGKTPDYLNPSGSLSLLSQVKHLPENIRLFFADIWNRLKTGRDSAPQTDLRSLLDTRLELETPAQTPRVRHLLNNLPFTLGALLVTALLALIFIGPYLAPNDPFATLGLVKIDGQLTPPPFPPGETFPWGTDALGRGILSLILAGAQQTLVLALMAVGARALLGFILGALAGWNPGRILDRMILGLSEIIAAFPTLLLAMILILGFGIRKGIPTFVLAFCLVGWGEIMQFVRAEVISIRPEPYIESAVASGSRSPGILFRHILPNLFPALVSIIALETGAVLMLLGELGFIRIFIGGGSLIHLPTQVMLYSDVPEWGALLSNVRYQARSYPWTALYPMLAFFISILSFNLFGEGLRRMLQEGDLILRRVFNRYTLILAILAVIAFNWLGANRGALPFYRQYSTRVDGQAALAHTTLLTDSRLEGRALGTDGLDLSAYYLARQFKAYDLQPGGNAGTYFQLHERSFEQLTGPIYLATDDKGPALKPYIDFAPYPGSNMSAGIGTGNLRVIMLGDVAELVNVVWRPIFPELEHQDFSQEVLLVLEEEDAGRLARFRSQGLLVVNPDPDQISRRYTLSNRMRVPYIAGLSERREPEVPSLWISPATAERLLSGSGYTLDTLREKDAGLPIEAIFQAPFDRRISLQVTGEPVLDVPVRHVIGYIPGTQSFDNCYDCPANKAIVVLAQYDSPPIEPSRGIMSGANDNASGVAVMLEVIRALQASDYQPYKTIIFIAYSGNGFENGEPASPPNVDKIFQATPGFNQFTIEALIHVRAVGAGSGDRLQVSAGGSLRLAELFERAARQIGVRTQRASEVVDLSRVYSDDGGSGGAAHHYPSLYINWEGWQAFARTPLDTTAQISADNLQDAGRTLALSLMVLGRETDY